MPAIGHPSLDPCPPDEQSIWRFMSVAKFVSLLSSKSLYLSSIAELRKRDPFEGTYPIPNHIDRSRIETESPMRNRKSATSAKKAVTLTCAACGGVREATSIRTATVTQST